MMRVDEINIYCCNKVPPMSMPFLEYALPPKY